LWKRQTGKKSQKTCLKQVEPDSDLRTFLAGKNVNPETIPDLPEIRSIRIDVVKGKEEKSPFGRKTLRYGLLQ
jgi:hypothetical protein